MARRSRPGSRHCTHLVMRSLSRLKVVIFGDSWLGNDYKQSVSRLGMPASEIDSAPEVNFAVGGHFICSKNRGKAG